MTSSSARSCSVSAGALLLGAASELRRVCSVLVRFETTEATADFATDLGVVVFGAVVFGVVDFAAVVLVLAFVVVFAAESVGSDEEVCGALAAACCVAATEASSSMASPADCGDCGDSGTNS